MFRAFLQEQSNPEVFYRSLARDTIALVGAHEPIQGRLVVDVGAGEHQFAEEFRKAGARYLPVDRDHRILTELPQRGIQGLGERLPLPDGCADIVMSSNVAEHVRTPGVLGDELVRIARPGGLIFLAYTSWASPWGGHETSPWHWFGVVGRRRIATATICLRPRWGVGCAGPRTSPMPGWSTPSRAITRIGPRAS